MDRSYVNTGVWVFCGILFLSIWYSQDDESPSQEELAAQKGAAEQARADSVRADSLRSATLWLARVIYSETKNPREQELIAWVVRNRVETNYRGGTYEEVVRSPKEFSAFNQGIPDELIRAQRDSSKAWQQAFKIAREVVVTPDSLRPIPKKARHFYACRSMKKECPPDWAYGYWIKGTDRFVEYKELEIAGIDPNRLTIYEGVH